MSEGMEGVRPIPTLKIKSSLVQEKPTSDGLLYKAIFDDKPETKNDPEINKIESSYVIAIKLHKEKKNEDANPYAKQFHLESNSLLKIKGSLAPKNYTNISVVSVADGLGGSGARQMETGKTVAFYGSRVAQGVIYSLSASELNQETPQVKNIIQNELSQRFSRLPKVTESTLKSTIAKDYPTTLSTAILREDKDSKSVKLLWTGDSPIFIFTPDKIYTTATPESGDAPTPAIYRGNYHLNSQELTFDKNTPLLVVTASDGLLKMGRDSIGAAIRFILANTQNTDPSLISQKMIDSYKQAKNRGEGELDDTTIALATSGDISKLHQDVPIKLIS